MPEAPRIVGTTRTALSPWVTVVAHTVAAADGNEQTWHSLDQADYVSVLALDEAGRIPLVRQFRPAVQRVTLELPGGLADSGAAPAQVAVDELAEETGYRVVAEPQLLGHLAPDSGRLVNRFWCYFARAEPIPGWRSEAGVERVLFDRAALRAALLDGGFDHAPHVALLHLAVLRGVFSWND